MPPSCASVSFIPRSRARGGGKERLEAGADTLAIGIVSVPASHEGHGVKLPGVSNRRAYGAELTQYVPGWVLTQNQFRLTPDGYRWYPQRIEWLRPTDEDHK